MSKPNLNDVTKWNWRNGFISSDSGSLYEVSVGEADNFPTFYKVLISRSTLDFGFNDIPEVTRSEYFYGESAWSDVNRYVSDETGWLGFDFEYDTEVIR